jgi:hypothetical protein
VAVEGGARWRDLDIDTNDPGAARVLADPESRKRVLDRLEPEVRGAVVVDALADVDAREAAAVRVQLDPDRYSATLCRRTRSWDFQA